MDSTVQAIVGDHMINVLVPRRVPSFLEVQPANPIFVFMMSAYGFHHGPCF